MEINNIQQTNQFSQSGEVSKSSNDDAKKALFGFGFRDSGTEKGKIDINDFNNPEIASKVQEQGLIGKDINDTKTQKQLTEIYKQSTEKTETLEFYDEKNGFRVYSRENLEDNSSVTIVTNEKTGLQQEIHIDSNQYTTVKNYQLNANGDPVEYKGLLISRTTTGEIYKLSDLERELKGEGDPNFDIELFFEETAIPNHINFDDDNGAIEILLYDNINQLTVLYYNNGHLKVEE